MYACREIRLGSELRAIEVTQPRLTQAAPHEVRWYLLRPRDAGDVQVQYGTRRCDLTLGNHHRTQR